MAPRAVPQGGRCVRLCLISSLSLDYLKGSCYALSVAHIVILNVLQVSGVLTGLKF